MSKVLRDDMQPAWPAMEADVFSAGRLAKITTLMQAVAEVRRCTPRSPEP